MMLSWLAVDLEDKTIVQEEVVAVEAIPKQLKKFLWEKIKRFRLISVQEGHLRLMADLHRLANKLFLAEKGKTVDPVAEVAELP